MFLCRREQSLRALCAQCIRTHDLTTNDPHLTAIMESVRFHASFQDALDMDHPECMLPDPKELDELIDAASNAIQAGAVRCGTLLFARMADIFQAINGSARWPACIDVEPLLKKMAEGAQTELALEFQRCFEEPFHKEFLYLLCDESHGQDMLLAVCPQLFGHADQLNPEVRAFIGNRLVKWALMCRHQRLARALIRFVEPPLFIRDYAERADAETLRAMLQAGFHLDHQLVYRFIQHHNEDGVLQCLPHGITWPNDVVMYALKCGCFRVAEAALNAGCPFTYLEKLIQEDTAPLRWALAHGAEWDPTLTGYAARRAQLAPLRLANELGLAWDPLAVLAPHPDVYDEVRALAPTSFAFRLSVLLEKIR